MYNILLNAQGEAKLGVGDMAIHARIDPEMIAGKMRSCPKPNFIIADGNISQEAINFILAENERVPLLYEPTDLYKADKIVKSNNLTSVTYTSPNLQELYFMAGRNPPESAFDLKTSLHSVIDLCQDLLRSIEVMIVTLGADGVVIVRRGSAGDPLPLENDPSAKSAGEFVVSAVHYPVVPAESVVSVSGAGDCFTSGFVTSLLTDGERSQARAVSAGIQSSAESLRSKLSVPQNICRDIIDWKREAAGKVLM